MKKKLSTAGVDEVGRGCLAGPVVSAAVILKDSVNLRLLKDSKKISFNKRKKISDHIKLNSYYAIGMASVEEILKLNILQASLLSMKRAINKLKKKPGLILIDGNKAPSMDKYKIKSIIKGDQKIPEISAASIIAKVTRDRLIKKLSKKYKKYSWHKNAGYGTNEHLKAIKKYGLTKYHRKTFSPIHNILSP